jgi:Notch-like protein
MPPAAYAEMAAKSRGLTSAVMGGAIDTMHLLLKNGFNANQRDDDGVPPLILAVKLDQQGAGAFHRDPRVVTILDALVEAGAKCELQDSKGRTAIWWAAKLNNIDAVKKLLSLGANAAACDKKGQTAAEVATDASVKAALQANTEANDLDLQ